MPWNIIVCPDPLKNNENNCLGYICDWIENSWITIVCFITEKCFPLVIRLTLDIFKCYFPLCHWERLHWFVVRERCAVNMELISVCTRDLTILDSQDTWAGPPLRTQWIFCNEEASDLLGGGGGRDMQRMHWQCYGCTDEMYGIVMQGHPAYPMFCIPVL